MSDAVAGPGSDGLPPNPYRFDLYLRCGSCLRDTMRPVDASDEPKQPRNTDDFLNCGYLERMTFACETCECPSAYLTAIDHGETTWSPEDPEY